MCKLGQQGEAGLYSPEMETLDQLLGGEMPLTLIRGLYPDKESFLRGVLGLLSNGDVRLVVDSDAEVPRWRWREMFIEGKAMNDLSKLSLAITELGVRRVKYLHNRLHKRELARST